MKKTLALRLYRLLFATLVLTAVTVLMRHLSQQGTFDPVNFFSFFTIQSNVFAALVFLAMGCIRRTAHNGYVLDILRGAATLYMGITGIVYTLLLSGLEAQLQTPIPWVNTVLHYIFPLVVIIDWLIALPKRTITYGRALLWLIFPLAYLAYSLVRGEVIGWYPYPFLNAEKLGYLQVSITVACVAIGTILLCLALARLTRLGQQHR